MNKLGKVVKLWHPWKTLTSQTAFVRVRASWETVIYTVLLIVAGGTRFWDLGSRSLNHDESIHGLYSWQLFMGQGYDHFPLAHGPFQFFGTALNFLVFGGASDYTLRILPALFGSALVLLPWFFRHRLGTIGALLTATAIAFSPTLLFFSRFARNDIYIALFTLAIIIALWRYIDERKNRYLFVAAVLLGLSFATKENAYINVAIIVSFLNIWLAIDFWRQVNARVPFKHISSCLLLLLLLLFAWVVVALWPFSRRARARIGLTEWHPAADFLILLGTLSLPQFAAAIRVPLEGILGIDETNLNPVLWKDTKIGPFSLGVTTRENLLGLGTIIGLTAASAFVGLRWNARAWLLIAAAFYLPYVLLFTSFFTNIDGFYSGNWGALDYWLDQQEVRRGSQPWFYYLMFLPAYEFLPLLVAAPAIFYYAIKGDVFRRFLVFWVVATVIGYSMAGEKMPWISVHTTLPFIVLGAFFLGQLYSRLPSPGGLLKLLKMPPRSLPFLAAGLGVAAMAVGVFGPENNGWLILKVIVVAGSLVGLLALLVPLALRRVVIVATSAIIGGLLVFTLFVGIRAAFQLGDVPRELYVYAQGSPDVPDVVEQVDMAATVSGLGLDLSIVVDGGLEPWGWYFRNYKNVVYINIDENYEPPANAIVLADQEKEALMEPFLDRYVEPESFVCLWWFPEFTTYKTVPGSEVQVWAASPRFFDAVFIDFAPDFADNLFETNTWSNWWHYTRDRDPGVSLSLRQEMVIYIPKDYVDTISDLP